MNDFKLWIYPDLDSLTPSLFVKELEPAVIVETIPVIEEIAPKKPDILALLATRLETTLAELNTELLQMMVELIPNICKKIIQKELAQDTDLLPTLLQKAVDEIQKNAQQVDIFLSNPTLTQLQEKNLPAHLVLHVDDSLEDYDFIIKTPTNSIHQILEQQLSELFGLS